MLYFTSLTLVFIVSLGLAVGFVSGLFGIGGGVLLVPILIKFFDFDPQRAIGISLAVIVPTALAGAFKHGLYGEINLKLVLALSIGGIIGGILGASFGSYISAVSLKKLFGVLMIVVGFNMFFDFSAHLIGAEPQKAYAKNDLRNCR